MNIQDLEKEHDIYACFVIKPMRRVLQVHYHIFI
jgi:hypothetical protein